MYGQIQYAPLPQVDYEHDLPNLRELSEPGRGNEGKKDPQRGNYNGFQPAASHNSNSQHTHTSGHKNFATFSAIPENEGEQHAAPSFLHYMAVAMSLTASSAAAFGVPKVMAFSIPGWLGGLQMSRTTLSAIISAANLAGALTQPCIGRLVDSWGPRVALSGMLALTSISFTAPAFAADIDIPILRCAVMFLALFGIRSLQAGIDTAGNVLVNNWFLKLRGRISSTRQVVYMSVQDLVLVQIVQGMDDWRATCWLSAAVAFCAVCIMLIGVTNAPEEAQLKPDGGRLETEIGGTEVAGTHSPANSHAQKGKKKTANKGKEHKDSGGPSFTLNEAMNTPSFWILLFNNVLYCSIGPTTTLMLLDIVLDTVGGNTSALKAIDVATCLYLPHFMVAVVVGPITGWLIDYGVQVKYILCYSNMCLAFSTALAIDIRSPVTAGLFGGMRGNVGGTRQAVKQTVWANYYGRGHLGEITGISRTCEMIGMALGPLLLGISREHYGEYRSGCKVMAVASFLLALSMLMLYKPIHPSQEGSEEGGSGGCGGESGQGEDKNAYQSRELGHPCRLDPP